MTMTVTGLLINLGKNQKKFVLKQREAASYSPKFSVSSSAMGLLAERVLTQGKIVHFILAQKPILIEAKPHIQGVPQLLPQL